MCLQLAVYNIKYTNYCFQLKNIFLLTKCSFEFSLSLTKWMNSWRLFSSCGISSFYWMFFTTGRRWVFQACTFNSRKTLYGNLPFPVKYLLMNMRYHEYAILFPFLCRLLRLETYCLSSDGLATNNLSLCFLFGSTPEKKSKHWNVLKIN